MSRRFRFNQPRRRRCDGRPGRGRCRRGLAGPLRLRMERPAAGSVDGGWPAVRVPVRAQRPEPSAGIRRDRVEELPGEAVQGNLAEVV